MPKEWMRRVFMASLILSIVLLSGRYSEAAETTAKTNILLISLDSLRADHVSCYGYGRSTTPNLDRLAAEGAVFEECVAASSWTLPSHVSIFTSRYPSAHGVERIPKRLGRGVPTLAGILKEHGYKTAAFVTGPSMSHRFGLSRGFDLYDDFTVDLVQDVNLFDETPAEKPNLNEIVTNDVITRQATNWLATNSETPFFLFVHYWDIHHDYIPPEPFDKAYDPDYAGAEDGRKIVAREADIKKDIVPADLAHMVALYDGEITHTDSHLGMILKRLDELGLRERTLVVAVSDHGEEFLEHGELRHGKNLFEEVIHVPWIVRFPGFVPEGRRIAGPVSHVDIMPTVLALARISSPPGLNGVDLSECLLRNAPPPERGIFSDLNLNGRIAALRWGRYKMIEDVEKSTIDLYRISEGREVLGNPDNEDIEEVQAILTVALEYHRRAGSLEAQDEISEGDKKLIERLRSLGYGE